MTRALLVAGLLTLAFAGHAHALPSDVKLGCLSGSTALGPPPPAGVGSGACTLSPSATANGNTSGMGALFRPVISPDGRNLYALGGTNGFVSSTVSTYNRNATTGALTFTGCITGDTAVTACTALPSATAGAAGSGMGTATDLAIAPDGKNVYAVAFGDDAIATFTRNPTTGALTFLECDTGNTAVVISAQCAGVPAASANGTNSGLDGLNRLAVSPINDFVAATSSSDDAGVSFVRNATTGSLTLEGCVTGETASSLGGSGACAPHPSGVTTGGDGSGFDQLGSVTYSPDGLNLYVASVGDDTVTTLARPDTSPTTGFTFAQCMSGSFLMGPTATGGNNRCNLTNNPTPDGTGSNLDNPTSVVVSNDGLDVLVASQAADAITTFGRGQAPLSPIGRLGFTGCLTGLAAGPAPCATTPVTGNFSGLHTPIDLAVAPDNTTVLVGVGGLFTPSAQALTTLTRNLTSGAIGFNRCVAGDAAAGPGGSGACTLLPSAQPGGTNSGQSLVGGVAVSPDNRNVYVTGGFDSAITWYGNDADGDTVGDVVDNCPAVANTNQSDLDGDGIGDVCDPAPTGPPLPAPPTPPAPPASTPLGPPGPVVTTPAPTTTTPTPTSNVPAASTPPVPALLKVRRAAVEVRGKRRTLRVDATIAGRANGQRVALAYRSAGVTTQRTVTVVRGRIRAAIRLPARQRLSTGVVTLTLNVPAAHGLRAQQVVVRAADRPAALKTREARILNKKLRVSGTISPLATGVVLIRMDFSDKEGNPLSVTARARIFKGKWKTLTGLEPDARDGGVVTIRYPGLARSALGPIRGEQDARAIGVGR